MHMLVQLRQLYRYDRWANAEFAKAMQALEAPPSRSLQLLAHIIAAQQLWMERIHGQNSPIRAWPDWSAAESATHLEVSYRSWQDLLAGATDESLLKSVAYTNSMGERWENNVGDIATHVAMHGTYHRGQIAMNLRANGVTPPYTDYIEAVRRRHLEAKA